MDRHALGVRLRDLRKAAGLTQKELAEEAGVAYGAVQDIEGASGNPQLNTIETIEQTLDKPLIQLAADPSHKLLLQKVEQYQADTVALAKDHQRLCDELAKVTQMNFSLQDRLLKLLDRAPQDEDEALLLAKYRASVPGQKHLILALLQGKNPFEGLPGKAAQKLRKELESFYKRLLSKAV
jgi:transcriptional regulator with XRE-family HTH domain